MLDRDLYEILGVTPTATEAEIRKAFHKLAKLYHPDRNPDDKESEKKFKEASFAHEVLRDKKKRAQYDQMRTARARGGFRGGPRPGGGGGHEWSGGEPFSAEAFGDFGLGDLFNEIFGGGFSQGQAGGGFTRQGGRPGGGFARRGQDREASLTVSFQEAARGGERALEFTDGRRLTVKIPEGVKDGGKIKLSQAGDPGLNGGPSGDLILTLQVQPHPFFVREGHDIVLLLPISFSEALLGTEIDIPTIDGKVVLKIPKGISSGQRLKLKGKGIKNSATGERGNQFVEVQIRIPKQADEAYEQAAKAAAKSAFNPRAEWNVFA